MTLAAAQSYLVLFTRLYLTRETIQLVSVKTAKVEALRKANISLRTDVYDDYVTILSNQSWFPFKHLGGGELSSEYLLN